MKKIKFIMLLLAFFLIGCNNKKVEEVTVTFDFQNGQEKEVVKTTLNSLVEYKKIPEKKGYTFKGWYESLDSFEKYELNEYRVTSNMTLYAKYKINKYTIEYFNLPKGTKNFNYKLYDVEDEFDLIRPDVLGYVFNDWYTDSGLTNKITKIEKGMVGKLTLYAKLTPILSTVNYVLNGGTNPYNKNEYFLHEGLHLENPIKKGYVFDGWYKEIDFKTKVNYIRQKEDVTLYAHFVLPQTLFEVNGNEYIYLGKYHQNVVSSSDLINKLNTITNVDKNGYIEYQGTKYKKFNAGNNASKDDDPYTFQNKRIIERKDYYFEVSYIKWRVLEKNGKNLKLLSEQLLEKQSYLNKENIKDKEYNGRAGVPEGTRANNYEYSDVRMYLNNDFYNLAFSLDEKKLIQKTVVDNSKSTTAGSIYETNNTDDYVYLLSYKDLVTKYGFAGHPAATNMKRLGILSDYARSTGCYMNNYKKFDGAGQWLLRSSQGKDKSNNLSVFAISWIGSDDVFALESAIRPVINIILN